MRRSRIWAVVVSMLVLAACTPTAPPPAQPSIVRIAWSDVGVPTPFRVSTAGPGGVVLLSLIYDTLTWKDERGVIPWLATDWSVSPDGLAYTFHIQQGVRWQDGQPLSANDVAFSLAYYAAHPYRWVTSDMVERATVLDTSTVSVQLKRPFAPFLEQVAGALPIIPEHVWRSVADPLKYDGADASLGSGPYRLAEYRSATGNYRLTANASYFKGKPLVDEIQQLNIPTETRIQAVLQGQAELAQATDASVSTAIAGNPRIKVLATAPLSVVRLVLNTQRAPFDRVDVRRGLAQALDRGAIASAITHDTPVVGGAGVIPPETPWFAPSVAQAPFDRRGAQALLGGPLTVDLLANPEYREPDLMQPMLTAAGITLRTQRVDAQTKAGLLRSRDFSMAEIQHIGIGGDPDFLRRWYSGQEANDSAQGDVFDDPRFTQLADQQSSTLDQNARRSLIEQLQSVLAEDIPTIPLYYRRFYWLYDSTRLTPINTSGGLMDGIPFVQNKLAFLPR